MAFVTGWEGESELASLMTRTFDFPHETNIWLENASKIITKRRLVDFIGYWNLNYNTYKESYLRLIDAITEYHFIKE